MTTLQITPGSPLIGTLSLLGDKSISHRAILLASLADGKSTLRNPLQAGVTEVMIHAIKQLGVKIIRESNKMVIFGNGIYGYQAPKQNLYCGNSATTIRMMAGAIAASGITAVLDGSDGLQSRPMNRIINPLQELAVNIIGKEGFAPLIIQGGETHYGSKIELKVASAQVKSCILLAALTAEGETTLSTPGTSRDHSEKMLSHMGVNISQSETNQEITIYPTSNLKPLNIDIPRDISSAAFLIVAALITPGSKLTLKKIGLNPTRTGILEVLKDMGGNIQVTPMGESFNEPYGDIYIEHSELKGIEISGKTVVRMIDEFPAFAVAAFFAKGTSTVSDAEELRYKETDRIAVICQEFGNLDIDIIEKDDGFIINGGHAINGGEIDSHHDHRIAMAGAILGLASRSTINVVNAEIIEESFPHFSETLNKIGANTTQNN